MTIWTFGKENKSGPKARLLARRQHLMGHIWRAYTDSSAKDAVKVKNGNSVDIFGTTAIDFDNVAGRARFHSCFYPVSTNRR
jgi:hypothetical protein